MEYRTVSTKLPVNELTMFRAHCEKKGVTPANLTKDLILREMNITIPHRIAGNNEIVYNKEKDSFSWLIQLDNKTKIELVKNISPEFMEDLSRKIQNCVSQRNSFLNKKRPDSVPIPSEFMRGALNET